MIGVLNWCSTQLIRDENIDMTSFSDVPSWSSTEKNFEQQTSQQEEQQEQQEHD